MTLQQDAYPVQFDVDYPEEPLDKLSTFFRILFLIPIVIVLAFLSGGSSGGGGGDSVYYVGAGGGILIIPPLLMILFRQKYPRWWFDWNLELLRFSYRIASYAGMLRDEYPSTDEEQSVHLNMAYPDVPNELNRWLPLVKWFLAIPHYVVLVFLGLAAIIVIIVAWFAILFTGRYPTDLFNFVVGEMRWSVRVEAYAFLMVTDEYPPFHLSQ